MRGKEIENYLVGDDIKNAYPELNNYAIEKYQPFSKFVGSSCHKIEFAKKITEYMTADSLKPYDLEKQIKKLGDEIRKWNSS